MWLLVFRKKLKIYIRKGEECIMKNNIYKSTIIYVLCIALFMALVCGKMKIVNAVEDSNKIIFYATHVVEINNNKNVKNTKVVKKLLDLNDGIINLLHTSETVINSDENIGGDFSKNIYSEENYYIYNDINYTGVIVADGDIDLKSKYANYTNCIIYSKNGNVNIKSENIDFAGFIYAPNGDVTIEGNYCKINGEVLADNISIKAKQFKMDSNQLVEEKVKKLAQCIDNHYVEITMYYNEKDDKLHIEEIANKEKMDIYVRYDFGKFKKVSESSDGYGITPPSPNHYIEAYVIVTDNYGEKKFSNIETFYCAEKGVYEETIIDVDKDGIPDGYKAYLPGVNACKSQNGLQQNVIMKKENYQKLKKHFGKAILGENITNNNVICRYIKQPGDIIECYYDTSNNKVISVYNYYIKKDIVKIEGEQYIFFKYDNKRNVTLRFAYDGKNEILQTYSYDRGQITSITHNDIMYSYKYDEKGRLIQIEFNDKKRIKKEWINDKKCKITLAGEPAFYYYYDDIGSLVKIVCNGKEMYRWKYDDLHHHELISVEDCVNAIKYTYKYKDDELASIQVNDEFESQYCENKNGNVVKYTYNTHTQNNEYNNNTNAYIYINNNVRQTLNTNEEKVFYKNKNIYSKQVKLVNDQLIEEYTNLDDYRYLYNEQGMLSKIYKNGKLLT